MTREEIEELKGLAASMGLYDDKNPCKRAVILGKAIKALEQEPIIDKIRAEIKDWQTDIHDNEYDADKYDFVFERIFEIIDEYKRKSEG